MAVIHWLDSVNGQKPSVLLNMLRVLPNSQQVTCRCGDSQGLYETQIFYGSFMQQFFLYGNFLSLNIAFPLFIPAWSLYCLILFYWVRDNRAPKALVVIGFVVGVCSVVFSMFMAIVLAFPAIILMLYVAKCSFWPKNTLQVN